MSALAERRRAYAERLAAAAPRAVAILRAVDGIERVSVFGSYARGRRDLLTDLDLLVVWRTDLTYLDRLKRLHIQLDLGVDIDVLCYTPEEFAALRDQPFLRRALAEEVVLHETKSPR